MPTMDLQPQTEAVGWLARLPFLGAEELSLLLGIRKPQVARVLAELEKLGWVEWIRASSPELDEERLNVLTDGCLPRLAEHFGLSEQELQVTFPVGRKEILERLTRLETTVGFNRFAAELVAAVRDDEEVELEEIRSLPWRRPAQAWWPPEVEGYGCLRWGPWRAPFFLVWDRAGAPPFHRRKRVRAWCAFRESDHPWGRDDIPPILVVCPREAEAEQWARAVLAASDRRQAPRLPVFLTDVLFALIGGPLGSVWRRPDGTARAHLCERLVWRPAIASQAETIRAENPTEQLDTVPASGPALPEWARQTVESPGGKQRARNSLERLAALSLLTSPTEKQALEWLGHHPLLSADDLAVILRVSGQLSARLLDNLARYGLVQSTDKPLENEAAPPRRYYLTDLGLKLLAARDGAPPRRYARYGIVAASMPKKQGGGRLQTLLRQLDHFELVEPKTVRSRRTIALPSAAVHALRRHRTRQMEERLMAGSMWKNDWGLVFTTATGRPLQGTNVTRTFQQLLAKAGLRRQRFHDLRHSCASLLLAQGVHPRVVMETLGHSQIGLTMNTYSHVLPPLQREAAARMDEVLAR